MPLPNSEGCAGFEASAFLFGVVRFPNRDTPLVVPPPADVEGVEAAPNSDPEPVVPPPVDVDGVAAAPNSEGVFPVLVPNNEGRLGAEEPPTDPKRFEGPDAGAVLEPKRPPPDGGWFVSPEVLLVPELPKPPLAELKEKVGGFDIVPCVLIPVAQDCVTTGTKIPRLKQRLDSVDFVRLAVETWWMSFSER